MRKTLKTLISLLLVIGMILTPSFGASAEVFYGEDESTVSDEDEKETGGTADIIFAVDSTGFMSTYIEPFKEKFAGFCENLTSKGVKLNMSVIEYRDIFEDGPDSTVWHDIDGEKWTADAEKIIGVLDSIKADGGGDNPETPISAFEKFTDFSRLGSYESIFEFPDEESSKFVFLLTDSDFKDYEDTSENATENHYSMSWWSERFSEGNVNVSIIGKSFYKDNYKQIYSKTGGRFFDIAAYDYGKLLTGCSDFVYNNTVNAGVKTEDITGNADIVFAIDSTGSMSGYIGSVKENLKNFVKSLNGKGVSLNMSVVEFRDIYADGTDSTVYHEIDGKKWTDDVNKIIEVFDSIYANGGGDTPETPIDAFEKFTDFSKLGSDKSIFEFPREDSTKFVFLLTDAEFKDYENTDENIAENHYNMDWWTEQFRSENVKVTVVSEDYCEPDYNYLYTMTGGRFIDIDTNDYYELMQEYSEWIYENAIDSDSDGIPDDWEINGVDTNHDGIPDLDLAAMGADPNVPDIFIEADWMEYDGVEVSIMGEKKTILKKSTAPSPESLKMVYESFKEHGINVHIDAGPESIMNYETGEKWGKLSGSYGYESAAASASVSASSIEYSDNFDLGSSNENWNRTAIENFTKNRWTTFKYCLFVNRYDNGYSSGIAENITGQFFIVSSGLISEAKEIRDHDMALAGTVMHELGHTLGLSHGGIYTDRYTGKTVNDHVNHKPNHFSIMNYNYQFGGLQTGTDSYKIDYQEFNLPEIDEENIDESRGIDPLGATKDCGLMFNFRDFDGTTITDIAERAIDFNEDGVLDYNLKYNLNDDKDEKTGEDIFGTLTATSNEWVNLKFTGGLIGGYGEDIDLDKVGSLIPAPGESKETAEQSVQEAFEKGLLGDKDECAFDSTDKKSAYSEISGQNIILNINNLYPDDTSVELTVKSDALPDVYTSKIDVSKSGTSVSIPLKDNLTTGEYNITYSMLLKNGNTVEKNGVIEVTAPEYKQMEVGESTAISVDSIKSCEISDNKILEIADGKITAKTEGMATVLIKADDETTYCFKITVVGHTEIKIEGKPATCTENGLSDGIKCSVCGEVIKAQEEIPALGHKEVKVEGKPATCTEKGLSDGIKCSVCGETIKSQEELPARGHSFKDGVCTECGAIDPDYKLILKKGSKLILDSDKKFIYVKPEKISGVTASEFKSEIESDITLSIADSDVVVNGLKFKFGVNEYTVIVIGDTSPDGKITAKDARTVLRIAARLDSPDPVTKEAADIDSDGKISSREARSILRFAARLQNKIDD
ncbi:MAG: VWA domain-containing protein [Oscillospiraceae bacterium]|nr:VWA domain-containing protein [Oscillospiraceae bacterium]